MNPDKFNLYHAIVYCYPDRTGNGVKEKLINLSKVTLKLNICKCQSWCFASCSTARVMLEQFPSIVTCGRQTQIGCD